MADLDVAIIGGGAAGISAARRLAGLGRNILLIEALPRLGGRAHTESIAGMPLDMGCAWLHSAERNPLAALADGAGLALDRREGAWRRQLCDIGATPEQQRQAWHAYERFVAGLHENPPPSDSAGDGWPRGDRWRPFIDGLSSFINGAELDLLSVRDFLAYDDVASDNNWRLPAGYGTFITGLADGLPAALGTRVGAVSEDADLVLETEAGTIRARAAIVAVSSNVLASGAIRFGPKAETHLHAAGKVPLGLADKVFLSLADPEALPGESHLLGRLDSPATGSYYLRPFGRPIIECFLGGANARALEREGEAAAVAFVLEELRNLLGGDFARGLAPLAVTHWGREPTILGSYSHALPGHADARVVLAAPVSERLCFAGEACSATDYSTAHGAWESGIAAADWIERHLP